MNQPAATAIRASQVWEQMEECAARRMVLILDCCFSGAFNELGKGDSDLERQLAPQGQGRSVLTASRSFEYSYEGRPVDGARPTGSVFTTGLIEGVRTGAADADGLISLTDAYGYAYRHVRQAGAQQTPQQWLFGGEGAALVLARSPAGRVVAAARLPEALAEGLNSRYPRLRIGAVDELAAWLADPDPSRVIAAVQALSQVAETDIPDYLFCPYPYPCRKFHAVRGSGRLGDRLRPPADRDLGLLRRSGIPPPPAGHSRAQQIRSPPRLRKRRLPWLTRAMRWIRCTGWALRSEASFRRAALAGGTPGHDARFVPVCALSGIPAVSAVLPVGAPPTATPLHRGGYHRYRLTSLRPDLVTE